MKLSYKSLLLFSMFFGLQNVMSMYTAMSLQNSLEQLQNSLNSLKEKLLSSSKPDSTKYNAQDLEYLQQYFDLFKGSENQLQYYIEKLTESFRKNQTVSLIEQPQTQWLITLERNYNESLEYLRDALRPYTPDEQNALGVILHYLSSLQSAKISLSKKLNQEDKNQYTNFINKSSKTLREFQAQFDRPKPQIQSQFTKNNNLSIDNKYLVNKDNYIKFINPDLRIPLILKTGNKIQQILTLNQFLTPNDLLDPNSEHSQEITGATGLNMVKYINNVLLENPTNKLLQKSLKPDAGTLIGGGPASCGYQALRNCFIILKIFLSKNQDEYTTNLASLYDIKSANAIFGDAQINTLIGNPNAPGLWRQQIIQWRKEGYDPYFEREEGETPDLTGEWLSIGETIELVKKFASQYSKNITIYASPKPLDPTQENEIYTTLKKPNKFHCFIIKAGEGNRVHWFTLVVTTNSTGQKTYTIADSTNIPRYPHEFNKNADKDFYSPLLDEIINLLES